MFKYFSVLPVPVTLKYPLSSPAPMGNNKGLLAEFWDFLKVRKAWWLAPIIILLVVVGFLIIFGQSSALSPFIYALF